MSFSGIMSEIARITTARDNAFDALEDKGVAVASNATIDDMAGYIQSITFVTYYTGSSNPSSSLGSNGDIYLKTGA